MEKNYDLLIIYKFEEKERDKEYENEDTKMAIIAPIADSRCRGDACR